MPEDQVDHVRADDSVLRKVAVGILVALIVQGGGWIYMLGSLTNQVSNNTKVIGAAMAIIEKQSESNTSIVRVMTLVEGLTSSVNRVADRLESVATEQNRRALIIDRADRHMETHKNE